MPGPLADDLEDAGDQVSATRMWRMCRKAVTRSAIIQRKHVTAGPPADDSLVQRNFAAEQLTSCG